MEDTPLKIFKCLSENMKMLEENISSTELKLKLMKTFYFCINYIQEKLSIILKRQYLSGTEFVKKIDLIKFKFKNENILKKKYANLKKIKEEDLFNYVENKYCNITKMAFVIGWLLGTGEEKSTPILEEMGTNFGYMLKISTDFINIERDIENAKDISYNMIANYGIHHCFTIFFEHKEKLIKGCMELDIYSHTMKEIIDYIEKCFDKCLNNTDLELASLYSSFTTATNNTEDNKSEE
jgi:geranylgeranyl pyrophosphate synthase